MSDTLLKPPSELRRPIQRSTWIVAAPLAIQEARLEAARHERHGQQIMTFEQAAVRLAGGFIRSIDSEILRSAIQAVLPTTPVGELEGIKSLPGMIRAVASTLNKSWHAGIPLSNRAADHPRLKAIGQLELAVLKLLPTGMMRPGDIAAAALGRISHAQSVLGSLEITGLSDLPPCWRPLIKALAAQVDVCWNAGPRSVPGWLKGTVVRVSAEPSQAPEIITVSAATAYHETVEAMRWVRTLLASGVAPSQIAIAAASPPDYDDHFLALGSEADFDLHFVHGVRSLSTRDGQAAAALADIVVRGLSQSRLRRLAMLCDQSPMFSDLPEGWQRILPIDAPLSSPASWERLHARLTPEDWPDGQDHVPKLRLLIEQLSSGVRAAASMGETFLNGRARTLWRKALLAGPATAIDTTLENLRQDDDLDACTSVIWMPASVLAASPRNYVRLLGLNSSRWPRGIAEDSLIPDHVLPARELDPLPIHESDRCDFDTILRTTRKEVTLSRARRDGEGRLLGDSPLLAPHGQGTHLRRHAIPAHAFSETDRLLARPNEFANKPQAKAAQECWTNWRRPAITAHDGLIRDNHPLVLAILNRNQSASSLRKLVRNPLGFVWVYALSWRSPQDTSEPLVLDPLAIGDLFHRVFDLTLRDLESAGGLSSATHPVIEDAALGAVRVVAAEWESQSPVPPALVWERTLDEARQITVIALSHRDATLPDARSYGEVPFGGSKLKSTATLPWDPNRLVEIPGTGFHINGYIDRLDISEDGKRAHVCDYKTGKALPEGVQLHGGRELQRCLYAFAVRELLGPEVETSASLFYPRENTERPLANPTNLLREIADHLSAARASLTSGAALPGPDTGGDYDDQAFALPANASVTYCRRKESAATTRLQEVARIWEAQ